MKTVRCMQMLKNIRTERQYEKQSAQKGETVVLARRWRPVI